MTTTQNNTVKPLPNYAQFVAALDAVEHYAEGLDAMNLNRARAVLLHARRVRSEWAMRARRGEEGAVDCEERARRIVARAGARVTDLEVYGE